MMRCDVSNPIQGLKTCGCAGCSWNWAPQSTSILQKLWRRSWLEYYSRAWFLEVDWRQTPPHCYEDNVKEGVRMRSICSSTSDYRSIKHSNSTTCVIVPCIFYMRFQICLLPSLGVLHVLIFKFESLKLQIATLLRRCKPQCFPNFDEIHTVRQCEETQDYSAPQEPFIHQVMSCKLRRWASMCSSMGWYDSSVAYPYGR